MTLGFKSHYGTYPATYHDDNMKEYFRDINCTGPVYDKTVLTVSSAIYGLKIGHGPRGDADSFLTYTKTMDPDTSKPGPDTIIVSTDPITNEFQEIKIMRIRDGLTYNVSDMPDYLKISGGVSVSGYSPTLNIGVINEANMDCRVIINGNLTTPVPNRLPRKSSKKGLVFLCPNPASAHVYMDIIAPNSFYGKKALVQVFDIHGRCVRRIKPSILGYRNRAVWDRRDARGSRMAAGKYVIKVNLGAHTMQKTVSIFK
jgi:hypothetical protein